MLTQEYYLTKEGLQALQDELRHLISIRRKEVADHIGTAADYGDLRENSEYDAAMEEQAVVERRIAELERIVRFALIIGPHSGNKISIGACVGVQMGGNFCEFSIVDTHESDPARRRISLHSPIGSALIGRRAGDVVEVDTPNGKIVITIVAIGSMY